MSSKLPRAIRQLLRTTRFWQDNRLLLQEIKYFRKVAIIAISFTVLAAAAEGITVGVIASFLQGLTNPAEPPITTGIEWFDVWFLATKATAQNRILRLSGLILFAIWCRSVVTYISTYYTTLSGLHLTDRIRKRLFEQLQNLSLSYYSTSRSGELINTLTTEVKQLRFAFDAFAAFMTRGLTLLAYIISMFLISWQLSVAAVMMFVLLSVGLSKLIRQVREASFSVPPANGQISSVAMEFINGIRTVKATANEKFERQRFYGANQNLLEAESKVARLGAGVKPVAEGIAGTILIVMVIVAFNLFILPGTLRAASLLTFMFVLFRLMPLVSQVNRSREQISKFQGSIDNIKQLLRTDNKPYLRNGQIQFTGLKRGIDFIGVDFGYNPKELIINNVSFTIEPGKTTALVGASGAGKTTLVDLIPRFYDLIEGQILIDGVDLREIDFKSLRRRMGIVSQDTFIFNASVRDNLAYGIESVDERAINQAVEAANAWEFIQQLPEGMDTILGDRGVRLSGGQRQRIAIARALLRNPDILILDEATSALDSVTEKMIQDALEKLSQGRTVIAIAHRLSTIANADKVVLLEQGKIAEQGTYPELIALKGKLWQYHQMQYELAS